MIRYSSDSDLRKLKLLTTPQLIYVNPTLAPAHTVAAAKPARLLLQPHGQLPELMSKTLPRFLLVGRIDGRQIGLESVFSDRHIGQAGRSRSESTSASNVCLQLWQAYV